MNDVTTSSAVTARVVQSLSSTLGPQRYALWFDRTAQLEHDAEREVLRVKVPSQFVADWIGKHFQRELRDALTHAGGGRSAVEVRVDAGAFGCREAEAGAPAAAGVREEAAEPAKPQAAAGLPGRHSLGDFIVGPCNELAYRAAVRMAEGEISGDRGVNGGVGGGGGGGVGVVQPPLFVHGSCGQGKTHLLQGLCRRASECWPGARVLYTTGEMFTNAYIAAVRSNGLEGYRRRMRRLDLIAVDDLHFIANKRATQQEFLHMFGELELAGARVVLASDCHPKQIKQMSDALVSRCAGGLVVEVKRPDEATRRAMVSGFAARRGMELNAGVLETLTGRGYESVREIEGTLTRVRAVMMLGGGRGPVASSLCSSASQWRGRGGGEGPVVVDRAVLEAAYPAMADGGGTRGTPRPRRPVRFEAVLEAVCRRTGVDRERVLGSGRHRLAVLGRSLLVHLLREMTPMSYPEIATAMGRRTHSTAVTADKRLRGQMESGEAAELPGGVEPVSLVGVVEGLKGELART